MGKKTYRFFFPDKSLYFECDATMPMLADAPVLSRMKKIGNFTNIT